VNSIDLAGTFIGSVLTSACAARIHWRSYLTAAVLLAALLNALCVLHRRQFGLRLRGWVPDWHRAPPMP